MSSRYLRCSTLGSLTHVPMRPQIHPTPAAAPLLNHKDKANHPLHGFLKIVDRSNTSYYVKPPQPEPMSHLSSDSNGALRVRCNSLSRATLLGRIVSVTRLLLSSLVTEGAHILRVGPFVSWPAVHRGSLAVPEAESTGCALKIH